MYTLDRSKTVAYHLLKGALERRISVITQSICKADNRRFAYAYSAAHLRCGNERRPVVIVYYVVGKQLLPLAERIVMLVYPCEQIHVFHVDTDPFLVCFLFIQPLQRGVIRKICKYWRNGNKAFGRPTLVVVSLHISVILRPHRPPVVFAATWINPFFKW